LPVVAAAAALTFVGYGVLQRDGTDSRELRNALALMAKPGHAAQVVPLLRRAGRSGPARFRAQADNLLASLLVGLGGGKRSTEAMRLYAQAIRLDATDDASKFDLELLTTLGGSKSRGSGNGRGKHKVTRMPQHPRPGGGAGATKGGSGY
jgi:hypothetical protein